MTRLWSTPERIQVEFNPQGVPICFVWNGERHRVESISRWRVDSDWWAARLWRDYFQLTTSTGKLVLVYRDLVDDSWWFQRLYD